MTTTFFPHAPLRILPISVLFDFSAVRDALSSEATIVADMQEEAWHQLVSPVYLPREMFNNLVQAWHFSTLTSSFIETQISDESFRGIVALGSIAIPLILEELNARPSFLFIALEEITGDNPIRPEHHGDVAAMTEDWVGWGRQREFL